MNGKKLNKPKSNLYFIDMKEMPTIENNNKIIPLILPKPTQIKSKNRFIIGMEKKRTSGCLEDRYFEAKVRFSVKKTIMMVEEMPKASLILERDIKIIQ